MSWQMPEATRWDLFMRACYRSVQVRPPSIVCLCTVNPYRHDKGDAPCSRCWEVHWDQYVGLCFRFVQIVVIPLCVYSRRPLGTSRQRTGTMTRLCRSDVIPLCACVRQSFQTSRQGIWTTTNCADAACSDRFADYLTHNELLWLHATKCRSIPDWACIELLWLHATKWRSVPDTAHTAPLAWHWKRRSVTDRYLNLNHMHHHSLKKGMILHSHKKGMILHCSDSA